MSYRIAFYMSFIILCFTVSAYANPNGEDVGKKPHLSEKTGGEKQKYHQSDNELAKKLLNADSEGKIVNDDINGDSLLESLDSNSRNIISKSFHAKMDNKELAEAGLEEINRLIGDDMKDQQSLARFLKDQKVLNPSYYASLICDKFSDMQDRKIFAMILILETRGKKTAVSHKGARGPWQIMPMWVRLLKIPGSLFNPQVNLEYAQRVLDIHTKESRGDIFRGLYRYSGGSKKYVHKIRALLTVFDSDYDDT